MLMLGLCYIIEEFYNNFNCDAPGQSQHSFMFNYMDPIMEQILMDVKEYLVTDNGENYVSDLNYCDESEANNPLTEDHIFLWDLLFFNLCLSGLQNTMSYQEYIDGEEQKIFLFHKYSQTAKLFSKTYCNEE